ncbi:hypothetical protein [Acuticoccus sp. I52.16.1]|uniref:hypothetical protein n=1 Tax=Acuticoccus sp. I52.16.1 TaxID=2928472 RepID=UPI001FD5BF9A|nr:hypothetical protein [Acuticoccus sp. I52.16.1]UOM34185.1 hypothetical protein MRB58_20525 [Acuticoccus sp. I52.16.1]
MQVLLVFGGLFAAGVVVLWLVARGTLDFAERFDLSEHAAVRLTVPARHGHGADPRADAPPAAPERSPLDTIHGPLQTVAALLYFVSGDGWGEARPQVTTRLSQVGNRRDVAAALRVAARAAAGGVEPVVAIDRLAGRLAARMDTAERACVADMIRAVAYTGTTSAARATRATALLLKG